MNYIEKRIFRRLRTELPVDVHWGGKPLKANTVNISCGGMFLQMDPLPSKTASEDLALAIHLPNQDKPVKLVGEVCRHSGRGVAVEFQGLYNDNILAIEKFVKSRLN